MPSPLMTATIQAAVLSSISNLLAQMIESWWTKVVQENGHFRLDPAQLLRFVALTLITAPPNYKWQLYLERALPAYPRVDRGPREEPGGKDIELKAMKEARGADEEASAAAHGAQEASPRFSKRNTFAKWFIDCISVGALANTVAFLLLMGVMKGQSWRQISSTVQTQTIPIIVAGYKIWPIASIISFTFVPVHRRIVFLGFIGLIWGIYMSMVASSI